MPLIVTLDGEWTGCVSRYDDDYTGESFLTSEGSAYDHIYSSVLKRNYWRYMLTPHSVYGQVTGK